MHFSQKTIVSLLVIATVGLFAYFNTFKAPFQFDDFFYVTENPMIKNASFFFVNSQLCSKENISSADQQNQLRCDTYKRRAVGYISFALNYSFHNLDVAGYHVFNICIHIMNALLLYAFISLAFRTPAFSFSDPNVSSGLTALLSSLFFVAHPVQTQAVTYISQRFTSLVTLFYLLSLVSYATWRITAYDKEKPSKREGKNDFRDTVCLPDRSVFSPRSFALYGVSLISAVLAMKTKEIAFTLPAMILLYELIFFDGAVKRRIFYLMPILLTMMIIPLSLVDADRPIGSVLSDTNSWKVLTAISRWDYLLTQFTVITTYIRLIFFPVNQNLDYDYPIYHSFFAPAVFLSFVFLLLLCGLGVYLFYRFRKHSPGTRLISYGIFWFFITLSVESSVIPIVDVIFEHRVYLPSVGAFIAVGTALNMGKDKVAAHSLISGRIIMAILSVIIIVFAVATYMRNTVWTDEIRLWEDVVKKSPLKARGYNNLGSVYNQNGQADKALAIIKKAIDIDPNFNLAYNNLGNIYLSLRQYDAAIENYTRSLTINSGFADVYNNRGNAYEKKGEYVKALEDYSRAIVLNPYDADYFFNRGFVSVKMKQYELGIADFTRSISLNPRHAGAYLQRGFATYIWYKDTKQALSDVRKACELGNSVGCEVLRSGQAGYPLQ